MVHIRYLPKSVKNILKRSRDHSLSDKWLRVVIPRIHAWCHSKYVHNVNMHAQEARTASSTPAVSQIQTPDLLLARFRPPRAINYNSNDDVHYRRVLSTYSSNSPLLTSR